MGDVVDVRPDQFLRAMRDTGDYGAAAARAGLEVAEVEQLSLENKKFDLAVIDCHMEWLEDKIMAQARDHLANAREMHMSAYRTRHPEPEEAQG
jgi:hypothetical protein